MIFIYLFLSFAAAHADVPTKVAFCDAILATLAPAAHEPVLPHLRQVRHLIATDYPPPRPADVRGEESELTLILDDLLHPVADDDAHARAVLRLRAIEYTLVGPSAADVRARCLEGDQIDAVFDHLRSCLGHSHQNLSSLVAPTLVGGALIEVVSALLCGVPILTLAVDLDPLIATVAAAMLAPTYRGLRNFGHREVRQATLVPGWPAQARLIADQRRRGGPAFAMVSGALDVTSPAVHAERIRLFFDSIFFTAPGTDQAAWLLIARPMTSWPVEDHPLNPPYRRRRTVRMAWAKP